MLIKFQVLGSSSSGNCSLIQTENTNILVDAGFSGKRIVEMLEERNVSPENLHAVFITHEHSDHVQGLRGLAKYENIKIFANFPTAEIVSEKLKKNLNWYRFETCSDINFRDFVVQSFSIPHDAKDPVGYTFAIRGQESLSKIAWLTDLGYVPRHVNKYISDAKIVVMESNYDHYLLEIDTKRPYVVKERIRSRFGHLPNDAVVNFLTTNFSSSWSNIILAHLSADCNSKELIRSKINEIKVEMQFPDVDIVDPTEGLDKIFIL